MKITAARLSEGNKIFPSEIHVESTGITIKIPGLFSGESKYFDFQNIASVDVSTPMIGYSTITIYAGGTKMTAHGFTKAEVNQVKEAIDSGKRNVPSSSTNYASASERSNAESSTPAPTVERKGGLKSFLVGEKSEEEKIRTEQRLEKDREALKNGAKKMFSGLGNLVNSKKINEARELHNELMNITDDIDIKIIQNKKEEAIEMIKKLNHTSTLNLPDESDTYINYWTKKRKEYIGKLAS